MTCRSLSILVTGAAGYIGSALVRELLAQGHRVTAVDSMLFGDRALADLRHHPRLQILRMDIRGLQREHLTGVQAWSTWPACRAILVDRTRPEPGTGWPTTTPRSAWPGWRAAAASPAIC